MAISMTSAGIVYTGTQVPAQSGGSGAAYTLDDYEEGTWTPHFSMGGNQVSGYTEQKGHYLKIGDVAHIWLSLWVSNKGSASGNCFIGSLPFTSYNGTNNEGGETAQPYCYHITGGSPGEPIFFRLPANTTAITVMRNDHRTNTSVPSVISSSHMGTYPSFICGLHYHCKS